MVLSEYTKLTRVSNAVAAGQTTINSDSVDTKAYDGCQFTVAFGAITSGAVTSIKLQGSSDDSTWNDLAGTSQTVADTDDNKLFIVDTVLPTYRYQRCVVSRSTQDSVVDSIIATQYAAIDHPATHDTTTVGGSEYHATPVSGTA